MQARFGALRAALLIGVVWSVWHCIPLLEAHRSLAFIGWWSLGTVATRVIITWLYNNTGKSVFVAALFHTMSNLNFLPVMSSMTASIAAGWNTASIIKQAPITGRLITNFLYTNMHDLRASASGNAGYCLGWLAHVFYPDLSAWEPCAEEIRARPVIPGWYQNDQDNNY
ncbi:MAG: hypothetical protein IMW89_21795 [Ktedonobacteraceae bacterium]|nr:hypothetical protein [Ktedonobacteraceae bacterium]